MHFPPLAHFSPFPWKMNLVDAEMLAGIRKAENGMADCFRTDLSTAHLNGSGVHSRRRPEMVRVANNF
jgi:hypothetical protein